MLQDLVVIAVALALSGFLAWFFFGPRRARAAALVGNVQEVAVTVRRGYSPARGFLFASSLIVRRAASAHRASSSRTLL